MEREELNLFTAVNVRIYHKIEFEIMKKVMQTFEILIKCKVSVFLPTVLRRRIFF